MSWESFTVRVSGSSSCRCFIQREREREITSFPTKRRFWGKSAVFPLNLDVETLQVTQVCHKTSAGRRKWKGTGSLGQKKPTVVYLISVQICADNPTAANIVGLEPDSFRLEKFTSSLQVLAHEVRPFVVVCVLDQKARLKILNSIQPRPTPYCPVQALLCLECVLIAVFLFLCKTSHFPFSPVDWFLHCTLTAVSFKHQLWYNTRITYICVFYNLTTNHICTFYYKMNWSTWFFHNKQ